MTLEKIANIDVLILGIAILAGALLADVIKLGYGDDANFGMVQIMGTIIGAVITIVGFFLVFRSR
jgi:hypothetical protein